MKSSDSKANVLSVANGGNIDTVAKETCASTGPPTEPKEKAVVKKPSDQGIQAYFPKSLPLDRAPRTPSSPPRLIARLHEVGKPPVFHPVRATTSDEETFLNRLKIREFVLRCLSPSLSCKS